MALPPAPTDEMLRRALTALRGGATGEGEHLLRQVLAADPAQPDALQLLGLSARTAGRLPEAIDLFRRSLAGRDGQPHVHNNLGNALKAAGEMAEAERHYRIALKQKPDYADAALNLGILLIETARFADAQRHLDDAARRFPASAPIAEALAIVRQDVGDGAGAVEAARRATALGPARLTAWHGLGQAEQAAGDFPAAEQAFRKALAIDRRSAPSWAGLSNALRCQLRDAEAESALRQALTINPLDIAAHRNLNAILWEHGKAGEHLASYRDAAARHPNEIGLRLAFAEELLQAGRTDEADRPIAECRALAPDDPHALDLAARLTARRGDAEAALVLHRRAAEAAPASAFVVNLCDTLLRLERADEADAECVRFLKTAPDDQAILSRQLLALRMMGDPRYRELFDPDTMTACLDVAPPDGLDAGAFLDRLAAHLRALHTSTTQPIDQTLEGGTQTFGHLFAVDRSPIVGALRAAIQTSVEGFVAGLPDDTRHPFFRRKSPSIRFTGSWSVRLHAHGFHTNHYHPKGWISSAFYVVVPPEADDETARPGWFTFGQSNMALGASDVVERYVKPQPGKLVLFPSYVWHGTVPFTRSAERMTVAFDAAPL